MCTGKSCKQNAIKITGRALISISCLLAGCASPLPDTAQDKRPNGNAGTSIKDMSSNTWVFKTSSDAMSGSTGYSSSIWSLAPVELPYPYQGAQKLTLQVGKNTRGESYALVGIPKGQFSCYKCDIRIKFDDAGSGLWSANAPLEMPGFMLITGPTRFIEQVKSSMRVAIEVPFFNSGKKVVEFKTDGFPW